MHSRFSIPAILSCLFLFQGCSNITLLRVQELKAVEAHIDSSSATMIAKLNEMQAKESELLRVIRADMQARFSEMDKRIAAIEGALSENQVRLSRIDEKTAAIQRIQEEKGKADSASVAQGSAAENLFKIAYSDFVAGRYDLALAGYNDMIKQFPESPLIQEGVYGIAECYYAQKDYSNAETNYFGVIKTYPASNKVCSSLYKLGLIYEAQKKAKSQKMVWDKLIGQCPDSEEAKAVKNR